MMLTSQDLICTAQRNLPADESAACLPEPLLNFYLSMGRAMFKAIGVHSVSGWFLVVPLSRTQVLQIEEGSIRNGFAIAEQHLQHGLTLDVEGYYLMGIYGDKEARTELKTLWRAFTHSSTLPIYAKGTTELGKRWMARAGFKPLANNPILQRLCEN